ncbi:MAG: DNA repair protein RecN [Rickettsiaceae bacterium]|nr:DNA repair protein RecN [Rickettsiaceae bacterium]
MLNRILIKNFVIIKEVELELETQLNCITGDSGSGKSLILDAIEFCINGSGKTNLIMQDQPYMQVVMTFKANDRVKSILENLDIFIEGEEIYISRSLWQDGKKRCLINNQPVTQKLLDQLSPNLITIYAQHSLSALFKYQYHLKFLDYFVEDYELIDEVLRSAREVKNLEEKLSALERDIAQTQKEYDFLKFMHEEISSLNVQDNEETTLTEKRQKLQQIAKKSQIIADSVSLINNNKIIENLLSVSKQLTRQGSDGLFDKALSELDLAINHLSNSLDELEEITSAEFSGDNLELVEERLFKIKGACRKYHCSSSDLKILEEETKNKLDLFEDASDQINKISKALESQKQNFQSLARKLSILRIEAASIIEQNIQSELAHLHMNSCVFKVKIESNQEIVSEAGIDSVIFAASTNSGTLLAPIDKIASGGEMARFMLALQIVFLKRSNILPMIIFDEIDTGIGGKIADSVGERLRELSRLCRVLVITHQPQVASKATTHILVEKRAENNITISSAKILNEQERLQEIARMLSGQVITQESVNAAKSYFENNMLHKYQIE